MSNNQDLARISGERMDREVSELFDGIESKIKLSSSENKYFSNLWGESDIPEVKWFTVAKRQVLNNKENSVFKDDVQDVINDTLLGWTDSITELRTAMDTVVYSMKKIESRASSGAEVSKEDYITFLANRIIALALLGRLGILVPEIIEPIYKTKLNELKEKTSS